MPPQSANPAFCPVDIINDEIEEVEGFLVNWDVFFAFETCLLVFWSRAMVVEPVGGHLHSFVCSS